MAARILLVCCAAILGACAAPAGPVYKESEAGTAWQAEEGVVTGVRQVTIEGEATGLGTVGGAAIGYTLGRTIGGGSGSRVAGAVGGVAGAVAGRAVESGAKTKPGLEIVVDLDGGDTLVVVQPADQQFSTGQRVRVLLGSRNRARVNPI